MKLDMNSPFCTVFGENAARFEQAGRMFDADGNELASEPATEKAKPGRKAKDLTSAPATESSAPADASPIDEQLAAQGV